MIMLLTANDDDVDNDNGDDYMHITIIDTWTGLDFELPAKPKTS